MEDSLSSMPDGDVELLNYMEFATYDGVDLSMEVRSNIVVHGREVATSAHSEGVGRSSDVAQRLVSAADSEVSEGVMKLLNSEAAIMMLIRLKGKLMLLTGTFVSILQCVDRNTAECLLAAVKRLENGNGLHKQFKRALRIACTDGASYNIKVEVNLMKQRREQGEHWLHLHMLCLVHVLARIHTRTFYFLNADISGMIATSLSLNAGGQASHFRNALRRVLKSMLHLRRQPLSADAKEFKTFVLQTFYGNSKEMYPQVLCPLRLAGGDWRNKDRFEYMASPGETEESVLKLLYEEFIPMVCPHAPRTFPRSRWSGLEESIADLGVLMCVHGLFGAAYEDFMRHVHPKQAAKTQQQLAIQDAPIDQQGPHAEDQGVTWEAANRANRGEASCWLQRDPSGKLMILKLTMGPMHGFLRAQIQASSSVWDTRQIHRVLAAALPGKSLKDLMASRQWPLLEVARGAPQKQCMRGIAALHEPSLWKHLPDYMKSQETQHLLFKICSREGAAVYENIVVPYRQFPYRLFPLLLDKSDWRSVASSCDSSRDELAASILLQYSCGDEGGLADLSFEHELELAMVVMLSRGNTVRLESLNATIRRRLVAASTQVSKPYLTSVSAEFVMGKIRRREFELVCRPGGKRHRAGMRLQRSRKRSGGKASKSDLPAKKKYKSGGGGAWRAYVSKCCRGIAKADFKALSRTYNQLSEDELAELSLEGAEAASVHRGGGHHCLKQCSRFPSLHSPTQPPARTHPRSHLAWLQVNTMPPASLSKCPLMCLLLQLRFPKCIVVFNFRFLCLPACGSSVSVNVFMSLYI